MRGRRWRVSGLKKMLCAFGYRDAKDSHVARRLLDYKRRRGFKPQDFSTKASEQEVCDQPPLIGPDCSAKEQLQHVLLGDNSAAWLAWPDARLAA